MRGIRGQRYKVLPTQHGRLGKSVGIVDWGPHRLLATAAGAALHATPFHARVGNLPRGPAANKFPLVTQADIALDLGTVSIG